MRILKKLIFFFIGIIVLLLIAGLFVKKEYAVERAIVINKPKAEVFNYVKFVKNQDNYSVWNKKDPAMKKDYKGNDGQVGFVAAWDSSDKEVGKGEQEIVNIVDGDRIDMKLRFKEPFEAEDNAYMITEAVSPNETKVKWGFKGTMNYPMNLMLLFMDMDKELGGALDAGLKDLKTILEKP
ncbi:SRPBCC family protein [Flavobacterium sp. UBA4197]|uniref:SRPBCC family protein n=1 Tax=Flavobacterium sp. UBA4197 TaxID=1946546 RepID=UPI00257BE7BD|nr:SRPBCC family protein [Flavobacterium sp. UBA4197]